MKMETLITILIIAWWAMLIWGVLILIQTNVDLKEKIWDSEYDYMELDDQYKLQKKQAKELIKQNEEFVSNQTEYLSKMNRQEKDLSTYREEALTNNKIIKNLRKKLNSFHANDSYYKKKSLAYEIAIKGFITDKCKAKSFENTHRVLMEKSNKELKEILKNK